MHKDISKKYLSTEREVTFKLSPVIAKKIGLKPAILLSTLISHLDKAREYEGGIPKDYVEGIFIYHSEGMVWLRVIIHELAN